MYIFKTTLRLFLLCFSSIFFAKSQTKLFTPANEFTTNCEGPSVDANGNIMAVNIKEDGTIAQINSKGKTAVLLKLPNGSIGNGIRFGSKDVCFIADFINHNVLKLELTTKTVSVYSHDASMNQPNDLAIRTDGHIFCSDPNWKAGTGQIWHVDLAGKAEKIATEMGTTNGIEVSPDEKILYVNESVQRNVWAFDLQADGKISNKRLLIHFEDGGLDGMRCDVAGNLYITRWGLGEVAIVSPAGKIIKIVKTAGKNTSNIAFGGKRGKTCYVTLQDTKRLESFEADFEGREYRMMRLFKEKR
jgi:gluconolactonase